MNNKTLVGVFVVVFLIVGAIWFFRRSPDLLKGLKLPFSNNKPTPSITVTPNQPVVPEVTTTTSTNPGIIPVGSVPAGLISCTAEVRAQGCNALPVKPVCGYNKSTGPNGAEEVVALTYNTACHYCMFFSEDNTLKLGNSTLTALGYQDSPCK